MQLIPRSIERTAKRRSKVQSSITYVGLTQYGHKVFLYEPADRVIVATYKKGKRSS